MSLQPDLFELHYKQINKIVKIIKTLQLDSLNGKTLAFLISLFGKTSLNDEITFLLRDKLYILFKKNKANIYDIVEAFNTLLSLNKLSYDDLKRLGLDKDFSFATQM